MARKSRKNIETAPPIAVRKEAFNVGAYVRLSAVDKKQKGDSIETQQTIIGSYIAERSDLALRETYIDNGLSGQTFQRPAFQRMIADMESGKINCCVTKDLSRFGRNAIDTGFYIEKYFPMNGVRFIAITDNYDSADGQSGGIMVSLKNMFNERYALDCGRRIRDTKQMNIRHGCFVGSRPPYGYLKSREDNHVLVPDEYAAPIVRLMYEMAASGAGVSAVHKWLNESGILPPLRYLHSIGVASEKMVGAHNTWSKGVIYAILKNRVYMGDMIQGKGKTRSYVMERVPRSEWITVENTHEGIVSRELFAEVQKLWDRLEEPQQSRFDAPSTENIFLRKLFCGHCGHTMFRNRSSKTQYRFSCQTRTMYDKSDCVLVSINENALKEKLLVMLRGLDGELTGLSKTPDSAERSYGSELRAVQAEIEKNSRYLKSLYESLMSGVIDDGEFKDMKSAYETKITTLTAEEKRLRDADYERIRQKARLSKASGCISHSVFDLDAATVAALIEKIRVFEDKSIRVKFTFMDEEISSEGAAFDE